MAGHGENLLGAQWECVAPDRHAGEDLGIERERIAWLGKTSRPGFEEETIDRVQRGEISPAEGWDLVTRHWAGDRRAGSGGHAIAAGE
jgi:hypothetical protein